MFARNLIVLLLVCAAAISIASVVVAHDHPHPPGTAQRPHTHVGNVSGEQTHETDSAISAGAPMIALLPTIALVFALVSSMTYRLPQPATLYACICLPLPAPPPR